MKAPLWIAIAIGWIGVTWGQRRPPNYSQGNMPVTSFSCRDKILGGYYADPETDCQMFHVCVKVPGQGVQDYKFLCPNNTSFDQENQICDDWFNIDCEASTLYYSDNFDLYRIGSDYDTGRVYPGVKLPSNNVNNAVSDPDDDYLRRADRGESVGNDLLRGSHSSNFFSNKNQGREDEEEVKKKPVGKSAVRKLLTGKRPIPSTTTTAPQPTQAPVEAATLRQNLAGRNRGSSNFRGGFRSFTPNNNNYNNNGNQVTQPQQQPSQQQTLEPQRVSYTAAPTTQRTYYTTAAPVTQRQNYYTTTSTTTTQRPNYYTSAQTVAPQRQNYYTTTTQRPNYYTTAQASVQQRQNVYTAPPSTQTQQQNVYSAPPSAQTQRQNGFTASPAAPTQRQTYFSSPATQQITGANPQPFANNAQNQNYYNPTQQPYNTYQSTTNNYQSYQTTQPPQNNYNPTDYTSANNNYETAKLFKQNLAAQSNPNVYNTNYNDKFEEPAGEFLKTEPSQNLGAANFNRIQNIYKGFNTSVAASYNTEQLNATTGRPTQNNYNNYASINRNTTPKPVYTQFSTSYGTQQSNSQNFYQSTTQKPFIQNTYNGTTIRNYNAASQTQYPTTQYNYYTTTTQKPYVPNQNYQTSQQSSSPNVYTTQKPEQNNYYSQPQQNGFYSKQVTQTTQNFYNQPTGFAKSSAQKGNQKKYTANYNPTGAPSIVTDKPRPFSTTAAPAQQPKADKDQYDYAYYDDAAHPEYDNLDTVEFVKTKSKPRS